MRISFAHLRERSSLGGWIDFAVFDARSTTGTRSAKAEVLRRLTEKARKAGHKIDQSALAFKDHGALNFYGTRNLVGFLSKRGLPQWTHWIED